MKRILVVISVVALTVVLAGCSTDSREKLYVLNWGEYMDPELVQQFEDEFNVNVVYQEVGSNETMENKISTEAAPYDIAIPSDYMVDKLRQQGLLQVIDYTRLTALDEVSFQADVTALYEGKGYEDYLVPYFWGTFGIMYDLESVDEMDLDGSWDILFDPETPYEIGMYESARDSVGAALLALGYDVNSNVDSELDAAEQLLVDGDYYIFGEDNLKGLVIDGVLDLALVYSGDYFDELYYAEEEEIEVTFGYYVPEITNIWVDAFVIPTTSENTDMAYEFINFFLTEDVAVQNADWVGYCPVLTEVYDILLSDEYGYDYDNYDPAPEGEQRVIFEFISDDRYDRLNQILQVAKNN
jgi:spermidine/putrescine-binding protein